MSFTIIFLIIIVAFLVFIALQVQKAAEKGIVINIHTSNTSSALPFLRPSVSDKPIQESHLKDQDIVVMPDFKFDDSNIESNLKPQEQSKQTDDLSEVAARLKQTLRERKGK